MAGQEIAQSNDASAGQFLMLACSHLIRRNCRRRSCAGPSCGCAEASWKKDNKGQKRYVKKGIDIEKIVFSVKLSSKKYRQEKGRIAASRAAAVQRHGAAQAGRGSGAGGMSSAKSIEEGARATRSNSAEGKRGRLSSELGRSREGGNSPGSRAVKMGRMVTSIKETQYKHLFQHTQC